MTISRLDRGVKALECTWCGRTHDPERLQGLSPCCARPLYARYRLDRLRRAFQPQVLAARRPDLWRYEEVLPLRDEAARIPLGEGFTPLLEAPRLGEVLGLRRIAVKDEGQNPTSSFKARGLAVAIARARELGATEVALPSAGNAGGATAAYAAAGGLIAHVVIPRDTPAPIQEEIRALGARVEEVEGVITDAGRRVAEGVEAHGWFDLSTLKEPYRVEGKKTMGYELFEQTGGGRLPDVVIYPTGGGTGLVGMWKAFEEMEALGWIGPERPRMVAVQADGCAPIVRAFEAGARTATAWEAPQTYASGLRVPSAVGDFLILAALRESGGLALSVADGEMAEGVRLLGATTGVFAAPEGGATVAAARRLRESGWLGPEERVVLFATGSGLKYPGAAIGPQARRPAHDVQTEGGDA